MPRSVATEAGAAVSKPAVEPISATRLADAILQDYADEGRSQKYRSRVQLILRILVEDAGVSSSDRLDGDAVERFDAIVSKKGSRNRANLLAALHAACGRALRLGLIDRMPPFPDYPNPCRLPMAADVSGPLSVADVNRLLDHVRPGIASWEVHRDFVLISLLAVTDLLRDEALSLRVDDIDLACGMIRVRRREEIIRSFMPRSVPIPSPLSAVLASWLPRTGCDWVLPGVARVGPWTGGAPGHKAFHRLKVIGAAAGVDGVNFESLRRFEADPGLLHLDAPDPGPPVVSPVIEQPPAPVSRFRFRDRHLTLDEATRLMIHLRACSAAWDGHRIYAVAAMALFAGLRRGEVLWLRLEDIDLPRGIMRARGHSIPIHLKPDADAAVILRGWLHRPDRGDTSFVFPGTKLAGPWIGGNKQSKVEGHLAAAGKAAGIPGRVTLESLRRLWLLCSRRVDLGDAWRAGTAPAPILTGPQPGRPGTKPKYPPGTQKPRKAIVRLPDFARWDPEAKPAIEIGGLDDPVFVHGEPKGRLSRAEHEIIRILLAACPQGLTLQEMTDAYGGKQGWRRTLARLRARDSEWESAIQLPGRGFPGRFPACYRILPK